MQPQVINIIPSASLSLSTSWLLTSSGVAIDTQTITIAGIVYTSVNAIGATPGNILVDASASAFLDNLVDAINNPTVTNTKHVALSAADASKLLALGIVATKTSATVMTLTFNTPGAKTLVVSETETNFAWSTSYTSAGFSPTLGNGASLQFVAASVTSGNGVFTVEVSNDGSNWVAYNKLTTNVTNTNGQTDTRVASVTLNSNTSSVVSLPENFAFFRVKVAASIDGAYSATAFIT